MLIRTAVGLLAFSVSMAAAANVPRPCSGPEYAPMDFLDWHLERGQRER